MTSILGGLLALAGSVVAVFGLYLLALAVASTRERPAESPAGSPSSRLAVLVPAHDEERLIKRCLQSLLDQTYPRAMYQLIVIADNCTDNTAAAAVDAGAEVLIRDQPDARGKGQALRWAMDQVLSDANPPDAVVVVDADSVADRGLLSALEGELATGHGVVQADYALLKESESPRSSMVAAGFLLFHRVRFSGRARLGMAANMVGNGMLFSRAVLEAHPWDAFTGVEDLEYSIRLRLAGIQPRFAPSAIVWGPGPATRAGLSRQRLRWEGGRFHVVRKWLWRLVATAIARRDARLLDAALDLGTPPLGLLSMVATAGSALTGATAFLSFAPSWALVPWTIALAAIPAFVLVGLRSAGEPGLAWRVAAGAPAFLAWKLVTYVRLLRGFDASRWDRSDRSPRPPDTRRVDIAGVPIDPLGMPAAISRLRAAIGGPRLVHVSTVNLDFVVRAQSDSDMRRILRESDLNLADGAPVVWLGRLLGAAIPERVAGADLVPVLLGEAAKSGARVFLLGGEGGVAAAAGARLQELHPGLVIAGTYEPPRARLEDMDNAEILARITESQADVLLVALGHPKQERWIDMHRNQLAVSIAIGVGCTLDLIAGRSRRAPLWMQNAGLEWAYRLGREPRRLLSRYVMDAAWLVPITARTLRARLATRGVAEPAA